MNEEENERMARMESLVKQYYTLLHVIHEGYWQQAMTPFWNKRRQRLQAEAEALGIDANRESEEL